MVATSGAGTANSSGTHEFNRVYPRSLVSCDSIVRFMCKVL